ncbi:hypothetical protein AYO20_03974 [Fonsecaea nubica]|uniref:Uncharacterized protein n=1 Tax=Fonsecaea nubica TaxID=856822 RepID=A0A178D4Z3_9EURO|nr:hypothetical protein AYO20_03974 [Fonsecaea nubica]OAL36642.1 hypothetical protein AYO20_03974 [Fonsecaea nubica]
MGVLQQTLPLSLVYFSLVALSGLILGSIRVPYLHPLLGARYAELVEMPIMLMVVWQAAQVTVWNLESSSPSSADPQTRPATTAKNGGGGGVDNKSLTTKLLGLLTSPPPTALLVGALALVWLLAAELAGSVVGHLVSSRAPQTGFWWSWGDGVDMYIAGRDVVSSAPVYAMVLLAYAVMPWIAWRAQAREDADKLLWEFDAAQTGEEDYCSR